MNREGGSRGQDIWTTVRETTADDWLPPTNLGPSINTAANETRASLSRDGFTMVFGSNRAGSEGQADVYITKREKLTGNNQ